MLPVCGVVPVQGKDDVGLSRLRIVGRKGVELLLPIPMTVDEERGLLKSAERIRSVVRELG